MRQARPGDVSARAGGHRCFAAAGGVCRRSAGKCAGGAHGGDHGVSVSRCVSARARFEKCGAAMSRFITTENTEITETSLCALWSLERDLKRERVRRRGIITTKKR